MRANTNRVKLACGQPDRMSVSRTPVECVYVRCRRPIITGGSQRRPLIPRNPFIYYETTTGLRAAHIHARLNHSAHFIGSSSLESERVREGEAGMYNITIGLGPVAERRGLMSVASCMSVHSVNPCVNLKKCLFLHTQLVICFICKTVRAAHSKKETRPIEWSCQK